MHWQDNDDNENDFIVEDEVVDLLFNLKCKNLPIDHGQALAEAIIGKIGWIKNEPQAAIHQVHVAESSHGWQRPAEVDGILLPSRRTKLILRMPSHRIEDCKSLISQVIDVKGHSLSIGPFKHRSLSKLTTIFSRYIETDEKEEDEQFIQRMLAWLKNENVIVKKMMSGLMIRHCHGAGDITTRKLMLSGLSIKDSLRLQQTGIGENKLMGIGIFLPHKGIDAVRPE